MTRTRTAARTEFLTDVLITAVEGGINYWAQVSDYDPDAGTVTVWELDGNDDGSDRPFVVTLDTIAKGIGVLKRDGKLPPEEQRFPGVRQGYWLQFWLADRTNSEDGDYDAGIADAVLQAGIFDDLIYG